MNDRFDGRYNYLWYQIFDITKVFKEGVPIKTKKIIFRDTLAYDEDTMKNKLKNSSIKNFDSRYICILKIPSYYLGYKLDKGEYTPCIPLIRTKFDYFNGERCYIIPNLILGVYDIEKKQYIGNINYNPIFNPIGLQFTDEQISRMREMSIPGLVDYALKRRNIPYEILLEQDEKSKILDSSINYYISNPYRRILKKNNLGFREMT